MKNGYNLEKREIKNEQMNDDSLLLPPRPAVRGPAFLYDLTILSFCFFFYLLFICLNARGGEGGEGGGKRVEEVDFWQHAQQDMLQHLFN